MNNIKVFKVNVLLLMHICLFFACPNNKSQTNWEDYPIWENTTKYSKIHVVNQNHKHASDTNRGTEERPLLTIAAAVERVKPGEKILIHKGIYREVIEPVTSGTGSDKMIVIEGAQGEEVIIKGSVVYEGRWVKELKVARNEIPPSIDISRSKKLWITTIDDEFFKNDYYPFKLKNLDKDTYKPVSRKDPVKNIFPCSLTRGMLYQDNEKMIQLNHYGDLVHVPGSFWVDTNGKTIHIHPFGNKDPNTVTFEIVLQGHLLKPVKKGLNYIMIKGLIFEHCANGFFPVGNGALTTNGGHHWIFENNIIRQINAYGLEVGAIEPILNSEVDTNTLNKTHAFGYCNVMNNKIYACGTAGILGNNVKNCIVLNNTIMFSGWQEAELYGECAGIKLSKADRCLISNNHIHHLLGGTGIWLQEGCQYSRITRNIIDNIATLYGAIMIEASWVENMVDNNFVWYVDGKGFQGDYSQNQHYYYNLVAYTSEAVIKITAPEKISLDSVKLNAKNNYIKNNMFIDFAERMDISATANEVGSNVFVFNTELGNIELKKWQERLISKWGIIMRADAGFNPNTLVFKWHSKHELKPVPSIPGIISDFANEKRDATYSLPGPFRKLLPNCDYYVPMTVD